MFTGLQFGAPLLLTFRHRAGVRPYTSSLDFAQPCVFTKRSLPLLCATQGWLPNPGSRLSRSYASNLPSSFQHRSLKRLGMLYQSTCVGFWYGLGCQSYFPGCLQSQVNPIRPDNSSHPSLLTGPGMLTWFPSTTAFALAFGNWLTPRGLTLRGNPSDFSTCRVSHSSFFPSPLLMSAFALPISPPPLTGMASQTTERSATEQLSVVGRQFSDRLFRRPCNILAIWESSSCQARAWARSIYSRSAA